MKAPALAMVIHGPSAPEGMDDDGDEGDREGAKKDAMEAFLEAVEAKDPKAMSEALEAHYDACEGEDEEKDDDEER